MLVACVLPLLPAVTSKDPFCPSFSDLNPGMLIAEKWAKRSSPPPSGVMKPKPFASLNHLTVPVAIVAFLKKLIKGLSPPVFISKPLKNGQTASQLSQVLETKQRARTLQGWPVRVKQNLRGRTTRIATAGSPFPSLLPSGERRWARAADQLWVSGASVTSTRRLAERPCSVALLAIGWSSPPAAVMMRASATALLTRYWATARARRWDSCL